MDILKCLSVDWDYFFPIHCHGVWEDRIKNVTEPDVMLLATFWGRVIRNPERVKALAIGNYHNEIIGVLLKILKKYNAKKVDVINFDMHGDWGHMKRCSLLYEGNWVAWGKYNLSIIRRYTLFIPEIANICSPNRDSEKKIGTLRRAIPKPADYDIVFICRSPNWTPRKFDDQWLDFVSYWKAFGSIWRSRLCLNGSSIVSGRGN